MIHFSECFLQLFVAMDPIGAIPIYIALTAGLVTFQRRKVLFSSVLTAFIAAVVFMWLGKSVFNFLGIEVFDFKVAGGIVLLLLALDMVLSGEHRPTVKEGVGIVPLAMPLLVGPAVITTLLIQIEAHPLKWVVISLIANLLVVLFAFIYSRRIVGLIGQGGMSAASKIIGLFLVAIAIMMIRVGIEGAFGIGG